LPAEEIKKKTKGNYYNCDKPGYFERDCRLSKQAKTAQPGRSRTPRKQANAAEHGALSWTACYNDACLTHLSEKDESGYFPRGKQTRYEKDDDPVQFNMAFGEPNDYGPEEFEQLLDDWYKAGEASGDTVAPEEFKELSRFEETERPAPEYQPCMDATYQQWARENRMLQERANAVLQRCRDIKEDISERREESRSLRRQFDSVTEHVDVLTEFLEKLRGKTQANGCAMCGWESGQQFNASIQTDYPGQEGPEDAWYFLEERPPAFSIYYVNGGYTIPKGVYITRELR
jgi:hypothetical protein